MKKLYTKIKKNRKTTVREFIEEHYKIKYGFPQSFKDKEHDLEDCESGKNRSLDDLYCICLSKFPNLTTKKFFKTVHDMIVEQVTIKESDKRFALLYCDDIDKWVVFYSSYLSNSDFCHNRLVYNYRGSKYKIDKKGNGIYSCQDVLDAVGS